MQPISTSEFESIVRTTRAQLLHYLERLVGPADAEDVVQIALSKAAAALEGFRGDSSPRAWLFKIATNSAHDWRRARRSVQYVDEPSDDQEIVEGPEQSTPERSLVREEMSRCVSEVLQRLPESHQIVLALSDCEELSDREVADVLGVTVGSAKIRLHRARARMKTELEGACSFYRDVENTLCCDRKQKSSEERILPAASPVISSNTATQGGVPQPQNEDSLMNTVETLPTKQKHLIGIGAAIAAGCLPCTNSFVSAAKEAGACERGVRFALETGLSVHATAHAVVQAFADETFAHPELDGAFRQERALLGALTEVAAALACNAGSSLRQRIEAARTLGATDEQLRIAAQIARTAKRGAEREAEAVLSAAFGESTGADPASERSNAGCCAAPGQGEHPPTVASKAGCCCNGADAG